jgi:3-dehydroquinate synthase
VSVNHDFNLTIKSYPSDYDVEFVNIEQIKERIENIKSKTFLVVDENIYSRYKKEIDLIPKYKIITLKVSEDLKTLSGVEKLCNWLLENGAKKDSVIIGIGGGVIQDICTFVSHIYYRGIKWIYLPTTLLGQSDSCIGAKCGINFGKFKNQIGVIHAPTKIYINTEFLDSLNQEDYSSGLGEILKLSLTGPNYFFEEYLRILGENNKEIGNLIYLSLNAKKPIIEEDEFEKDLRRVLNYGHSFGHALESVLEGKMPHGLAVVWGIDIINFIGTKLEITPIELFSRIRIETKKIFQYRLETNPDVKLLLNAISHDKKILNNRINFALLKNIGEIIIKEHEIDEVLERYVVEYLETDYVFRPS